MKRKLHKLGFTGKYKHLWAAVAGAAVLSSAALPGIPAAKVHAAANSFKVDLNKGGDSRNIQTISSLGDMTHPASISTRYTNAAPATTNQVVLYQTAAYNNWSWQQGTYPAKTAFSILLQRPHTADTTVPANILAQLDRVDFNRQFLVYAHLGSVNESGYGIGIQKIVQTGNTFTVTVKTKSPQGIAGETNQMDDFVILDRTALNLSQTIIVNFLDQNGAALSTYTFSPA